MKTYKDYPWVSTLPTPEDPNFHAECPELGIKVTAHAPVPLQEAMEDAYEEYLKGERVQGSGFSEIPKE